MKDSRSKANARDKARYVWLKQGDGDNRASLRKAIGAIVKRATRLAKRTQMQHRKDIAHLMIHPLAKSNAADSVDIRNILKAMRRARR